MSLASLRATRDRLEKTRNRLNINRDELKFELL